MPGLTLRDVRPDTVFDEITQASRIARPSTVMSAPMTDITASRTLEPFEVNRRVGEGHHTRGRCTTRSDSNARVSASRESSENGRR